MGPIARSTSQNTITMVPVSAPKIYRVSPSRSISPATDGLPVGSLVTTKPDAVQIQVSDRSTVDSTNQRSPEMKRKQVFPVVDIKKRVEPEKERAIKVTEGP